MSRAGRTLGAAAVRLVGLLAVVLGLLGMHGLASTHHAAVAAPAHAAPAHGALADAASAVVGEPVTPRHRAQPHQHGIAAPDPDPAAPAASSPRGATTGPAVPACHDDCPSDVAVLCAAVLVTAAAAAWLIAATARRRVPAAGARRGPRPRAPAGARQLVPGRDPVAELCVSRT